MPPRGYWGKRQVPLTLFLLTSVLVAPLLRVCLTELNPSQGWSDSQYTLPFYENDTDRFDL